MPPRHCGATGDVARRALSGENRCCNTFDAHATPLSAQIAEPWRAALRGASAQFRRNRRDERVVLSKRKICVHLAKLMHTLDNLC